jgi:hypothetical protein
MAMPGRASRASLLTVEAFPLFRHHQQIIFGTAQKKGCEIVV